VTVAGTRLRVTGNQYGNRRWRDDDQTVGEAAATGGSADPDPSMLYLCMEVAGCPTVCRHCWAQGTGYGMMPLADIAWVLEAAAATGTVNLWLAFHGVGEVHDRQVNRRGAYAEACLAAKRGRAAGLSIGCNVFLTTASLPQLDELTATVRGLADAGKSFETASHLPPPRSRRNERLRPTLPQLGPAAARIARLTALPDRWISLETRTETAYVLTAQAIGGPSPRPAQPVNLP
jgi:hypothetical protein